MAETWPGIGFVPIIQRIFIKHILQQEKVFSNHN